MRTDTAGLIFFIIIGAIIFILGIRLRLLGFEAYGRVMLFMSAVSLFIGLLIKSKFKLK